MRRFRGILVLFLALIFMIPSLVFGLSIRVTWNPNTESDLAGYKVYYGTQSGVYGNPVDVGNVTTWNLDNVAEKTTYYFALTAYDTSGNESLKSEEASVTTPDQTPPNAPNIIEVVPGVKSVDISWSSVADAKEYKLYYGTVTGVYDNNVLVTGTSYSLQNLLDDKVYYFVVSAIDAAGNESVKSAELSAKTADTTAPNPPTKPTLSWWDKLVSILKKFFRA